MKKIMILGAGIYQVPLIKKAKAEGYYTIVVSIPGNYPGFELADEISHLNTTDYVNVCELAREKNIDAILTTGTDVALITIGYVCDKLNLHGISFEAARVSTDKALMKDAFEKGNVSTAKHAVIHNLDEAREAACSIGYPVMLKIVDKSGSRGITKVLNEDALQEAYSYGAQITNSDHMIVEKYIDAHEIGIDAFIQDGQIKLFVPHDKLVLTTNRTGIPKGHICPMSCDAELYKELCRQTKLAVDALHLDNCAVNIDAFVTEENKVYIIEATGRCGATGIPEVISSYSNIDYYKIMLDNSLGRTVDFPKETNEACVASALIFSGKTGNLVSINYQKSLLSDGDSISFDYPKGHLVRKAENGTDRIGMLIVKEKNREALMRKIQRFEDSLNIEVEPLAEQED